MRGKTLAVIGYGSIGRETARIAQGLGMDVLALKRKPNERHDSGWNPPGIGDPDGTITRRWYGPEQCEEMLREADYVTVTLPLTGHTRGFVGRKEIAAIDAKLGNTDFLARAPEEVVEENRDRREAAAARIAKMEGALKRLETM